MALRKHPTSPSFNDHSQLEIRHEPEQGILWYYMDPHPRPCFTRELLDDIYRFQRRITEVFASGTTDAENIRYLVLASRLPGVFNLGGDLHLFMRLIRSRDREALERYAKSCLDVLYPNAMSLDLPVTTISLVQGAALGGGFEAALSSSVLIAERSAQMGLPEILFNLFPGMGAYSFLSRRLDASRVERLILSGRSHSAEALYEMGLVDVLADDGEGEAAVHQYVKKQRRCHEGTLAIHRLRHHVNPLSYDELLGITHLWVDTALKLEDKDLRVMERLVKAQNRIGAEARSSRRVRASSREESISPERAAQGA